MFGLGGRGQAAAPVVTVVETGPLEGTAEVHTPGNPYCGNLSCWCHTDLDYHDQVTSASLGDEVDDSLFAFAMSTLGAK